MLIGRFRIGSCMHAHAGSDGVQQSYDGYLVGADRTKDLAVLHINAPKV